jgi:hypothetical protein
MGVTLLSFTYAYIKWRLIYWAQRRIYQLFCLLGTLFGKNSNEFKAKCQLVAP